MFVPAGKSVEYGARGWDVSPYGEWQWTPMALAGRDPIFYAQLESEIQMLHDQFGTERSSSGELVRTLVDTCLRCHAAMGKRQFEKDRTASRFTLDHVHTIGDPAKAAATDSSNYGALARDGVGCAVCHRMQLPVQPATDRRPYLQFYLESATTGNFHLGKKGEIYGPFKNEEIAPYAMEHATGLKPTHSDYLKSSQLCGTCHTVALPIVGKPLDAHPSDHANAELMKSETVPVFRKFHHHLEQATYLEWLNSAYENEINKDNPQARTCQDCHMSRGLKDPRHGIDLPQIQTRIAAIQDTSYPEAENLAPHNDLQIRFREDGYRRHNFSGLNMFLLEMFNQCDDILGVRKTDFMTGSTQGIEHAMENYVQTAQNDVASVDVAADILAPNEVTAVVVVKNKVGHRFPTGVGFRRAFIELVLVEQPEKESGSERIVWASGRTNDLGVLTGMDGEPLPTEFFASDPISGQQRYQKHHAVIRFPDQVQIYETLLRNEKGQFTTSFINGCEIVKDNRLLPRGWKQAGPGPDLTGKFLEATFPDPQTARNPRYKDGSGSDEVTYHITIPDDIAADRLQVRATLYYQAIPPYYLRNLFATAADGPATRRLHYLCSHLNLNGTPIENWKLQIASAACRVIKD